jgi:hypothetical protein
VFALVRSAVGALVGTAAAMLPRRYWDALDTFVPASRAAPWAALLTLVAGAAIGFRGFLTHLAEVASLNNALYMDAALKVGGDTMPLPSGPSSLALFTFILLTPEGWASSYLVVTGVVRAVGSQFDDPHGDFLLTLIDAGARKVAGAATRRAALDNRHRLEGPAVGDRIVRGAQRGLPAADLVIVSSRIKDGWEPGAVVLSDRGEFRILAVEDRIIEGRLRHLYALAWHQDLEAFRRTVRYAFPDGASVPEPRPKRA